MKKNSSTPKSFSPSQLTPQLLDRLRQAERVCVLTGAGVSAESGVPTFRDLGGLWSKFKPEELASMEGFLANPSLVWEWYQHRRFILTQVNPNPGHLSLAQMEEKFSHFTLITQNVDNLHQRAGQKRVLELHGNLLRNYCSRCGEEAEIDSRETAVPRCHSCSGLIRPGVVWFGEMLLAAILEQAYQASEDCDVFFSIGTSAVVYPAAALPQVAKKKGAYLIEINPTPTELTDLADEYWAGPSGKILPALMETLWPLIPAQD